MKRLIYTLTLAVFALAIPVRQASAQSADPVIGTWHLDIAHSKFSSGPAPKSQTRTYEVSGDFVKQTGDSVDSQGNPVHVEFTAKYDGKDYPMTGNADADTIAMTRVDAYTTKSTLKKAGQAVVHSIRHITKDGKKMTVKSQGTNTKGEKFENILTFERQ
jgi:hypothetical protein